MDGDADGYGRGGKRILKIVVRVLSVMLVWSLFIGILASRNSNGLAVSTSLRNLRHVVAVESRRHYVPVDPNTIYASKRRVPSGPDPIHNRHIGANRRSPGRV